MKLDASIQSAVALVGVLVLAGLQVIDGDAALAFLAGLLVKSPVTLPAAADPA